MFKIIPRKVCSVFIFSLFFGSFLNVSPAQASLLSSYLDKFKSTINSYRKLPRSIFYDTVKINKDAQYTRSAYVALYFSIDGLILEKNSVRGRIPWIKISNDGINWTKAESISYRSYKLWRLSPGDGIKTVYVKFAANLMDWSAPAVFDTIILDTTPPKIVITSPQDGYLTNQKTVTLNYTADGVAKSETRTLREGLNTLIVRASDLAGNTRSALVKVILDTSAPNIVIASPKDKTYVNQATVLLQGTIDGEAFSEERALTSEGENTLTKSVTDASGNTSSASVTVYYYTGKLIGKEGGEVSSSDGKLKLIIPPDALTEPQPISISSVDLNSLKDTSIPKDTSLLAIAECLPKGLVFQKEVDVIYILDQAEIPGTSVELGLYDRLQNKIIPVGHTTTVPSDGYTITCHINHFSTYAALKGFISQGAPIGAGVKVPLPDMFTGSFSHAIPITVPPGRKGIQPSLGLSYRSGNGNSWVGVGYSLNPGYITRSTKLGPPSYDDKQDTFYFISDSGTTELVYLTENLYQSKIESSFTKFFKESDDSWRALSKDGSMMLFGKTTESKEGSSNKGIFSWYLTKAQDTNGNYLKLSYTKDQGKSYLSKIDYTGNDNISFSPSNSVEFFLEDREDVTSSYITASKIVTAKRLKEIQASAAGGSACGGKVDLVWRYALEYIYCSDTNRSMLTKVTQFGADDKNLPAQTFKYQKANEAK